MQCTECSSEDIIFSL